MEINGEQLMDALIPVGTIVYLASQYIPEGWLHCDGSYLGKERYARLYEALGTLYGERENEFRLPDTRGQFLRVYDSAAGIDPGRALGSIQGDAIRNIAGYVNYRGGTRILPPHL